MKDAEELVRAVAVASALGSTSAYTWLKLPPTPFVEEMMAATTLPALLLGGDPAGRWDAVVEEWRRAMAVPNVRGLVAGRGLLYPAGDDVEAAVAAAAAIVHASPSPVAGRGLLSPAGDDVEAAGIGSSAAESPA
jgi:hypothetical protein